MRKSVLPFSVLALSFFVASLAFGQTPVRPPDLQSADWSVKQAKILNAESKDAVRIYIQDPWSGSQDFDVGFGGKVCEFHFVDLRHSGQLSLVVSDDHGGRED